jgi:hypothetical protein
MKVLVRIILTRLQNGHTEGQAGCKQTCVEHVCHVYRYQGHEVSLHVLL